MTSIGRKDRVNREVELLRRAYRYGLLPDAEVYGTYDLTSQPQFLHDFFEPADAQHVPQVTKVLVTRARGSHNDTPVLSLITALTYSKLRHGTTRGDKTT